MKNIVYLHPHFILPWWAGNFALQTAKYLSREQNYRIYIISWPLKEELISDYRVEDINFIEVKMPLTSTFLFWLFYPVWLSRVFKEINLLRKNLDWDFILFPQVFPVNWFWFIFKLIHKNTRLVFMCHEPSAFIHSKKWIDSINSIPKRFIAKILNPALKIIDVYLTKASDYILVNSNFSKEWVLNVYGRADWIIYPGFDWSRFHIDKNIPKEKYIWVLSRLTKFKNVWFVIDLFAEFVKEFPGYTLKIWWEWEEKELLKNKVKELWLEIKVVFLNISDEELPGFYQRAKLIIFASENEPFWIVPVEAMACWTYVVWNNSWWLKETIPDELRYDNAAEALKILRKIANSDTDYNSANVDKFEWNNSVKLLKEFFNN
ncbi:MAG: Glycosyltransferase WbaZ [uncultured bacterium (gcode 4)]|uniref:Glycosyltransferase WbaZ n=1 Tax=uncultured bacterium (gcode 4) TaxID=1234023 RepID=K2GXU4_9BACT|nr:MAG: Glycosyltransferase WbaZ [uncultured bacterium (gcode 4)]